MKSQPNNLYAAAAIQRPREQCFFGGGVNGLRIILWERPKQGRRRVIVQEERTESLFRRRTVQSKGIAFPMTGCRPVELFVDESPDAEGFEVAGQRNGGTAVKFGFVCV